MLAPCLIQPKGSIVNLKGMTQKLACLDHGDTKHSEQLSPTMGALFWESPFIINMHMFGPDDAMKKLINELFFVQADGSLSVTYSYTKIARYFTPEIIGILIGTIYKEMQAIHQGLKSCNFEGNQKQSATKFFHKLTSPRIQRLGDEISEKIIKPYALQNASDIKKAILDGLKNTKQRYQASLATAQATIAKAQAEQNYINCQADFQKNVLIAKGYIEKLQKLIQQNNLIKTPLPPLLSQIETYIQQLEQLPKPEGLSLIVEKFNKLPFPKTFRKREVKEVIEPLEVFCKHQLAESARLFSAMYHAMDKDLEQVETADRLIKKLDTQYNQETLNLETIKHEELQKSIDGFGKLIANALAIEHAGTYQSGTVIDILLAFLWNKFSTPQEFDRYCVRLITTMGLDGSLMPVCSQVFTKNDYERLKRTFSVHDILNLSFDELVYVTLGYNFYDNILPPHIKMLNSVKYRGLEFPDCGETSLRNLINALIYDNAHSNFNIDKLKKLGAIPTVINYYCRYQSPTVLSIAEQESHDEWAKVVSSLPNVKYGEEGICDIEPGIANMLCVVNNLFPGITSLEDLIKKLDDKLSLCVKLKSSQPLTCDTDNVVTLTIRKNWDCCFDLVWQFDEGHFELKYPDKIEISFAKSYCDALAQRACVSKSDAYCMAHLRMAPEKLSFLPCLSSSHTYMFMCPQYANKEKIEAATHLIGQITSKKDRQFVDPYLLAINEKISRTGAVIDKLLEAVSKNNSLDEILIRAQKDSAGRSIAIERVIKDKKVNLYKWASSKEILKTITGSDAVELAMTILKQQKATNEQTEAFMKALYSWKANILGADQEDLQGLIFALFDWPENYDSNCSQFASQFFDLELPENFFEKIPHKTEFNLIVNLIKHPMTQKQEQTPLGKFLTLWAINVLKKNSPCLNVITALLLERAHLLNATFTNFYVSIEQELTKISPDIPKDVIFLRDNNNATEIDLFLFYILQNPMLESQRASKLGQAVIQAIPQITEKIDYFKICALIMHLLNFVIFTEHEHSQENEAMLSAIPRLLQKNCNSCVACNMLSILIESPMTHSQEQHRLGQLIISFVPRLVDSFKAENLWFPPSMVIVFLLRHLPAIQQENSEFLRALLKALPALLSKINSSHGVELIKYLLENPLTETQELCNFGQTILSSIASLVDKIDRYEAEVLIKYLLEHPLASQQQATILGQHIIKAIARLVEKVINSGYGIDELITYFLDHPLANTEGNISSFEQAINQAMTKLVTQINGECGSVIFALLQHQLTPELEKTEFGKAVHEIVPQLMEKIDAKSACNLITHLIQHPSTAEEKQNWIGEHVILAFDQLIKNIASESESAYKMVDYLIRNPMSLEQERQLLGQKIIQAFPEMLSSLDNVKSFLLIKSLLKSPMTESQENGWLGNSIKLALPQLLSNIIKNVGLIVEYLFHHPLTIGQEQHWLGQAILPVLPQMIKKVHQCHPERLLDNILKYPLSEEQINSNFGQIMKSHISVESLVEQIGRQVSSYDDARFIWEQIKYLLDHPLTKQQEESGFGPAILACLPKLLVRLGVGNIFELIEQQIQSPITLDQEQTGFQRAILSVMPQLLNKISGDKQKIINILRKQSLTAQQEKSRFVQLLISLVPQIINEIIEKQDCSYSDVAGDFVTSLIQHPLTPQQEQGEFGQALTTAIPRLIEKFDVYNTGNLIIHLFNWPQESSCLRQAMITAAIKKLEELDSGPIIEKLLTNPLTEEQEKTRLGLAITTILPKMIMKMKGYETVNIINYLLQHPMTSEQEKSTVSQIIIAALPKLIIKIENYCAEGLIKDLLNHPLNAQQEEGAVGKIVLTVLPQLVEKIYHQNGCDFIKYLLEHPMTSEQQNSVIGRYIMSIIPALPTKLDDYQCGNLVKYLAKQPLTPQQEQQTISQVIIATLPQLIMKMSSYKTNEAIKKLLEHPMTAQQEEHWLGKAIIVTLPHQIMSLSEYDASQMIIHLLQHPLTRQQEMSKSGQAIIATLPGLIEKVCKSEFAPRFITDLLYEFITQEQENQVIGKAIIASLPDPSAKFIKPEDCYYLVDKLLTKPLSYAQENSRLGHAILPAIPGMIEKIANSEYAAWIIIDLVYKPLTPAQEQQMIGKSIIAALPRPLEKFDKPEYCYRLISRILREPLSQIQEQSIFGRVIMPAIAGMIEKIANSDKAADLITDLIVDNPLTPEQKRHIIGQTIKRTLPNPVEKFDNPHKCDYLFSCMWYKHEQELINNRFGRAVLSGMPRMIEIISNSNKASEFLAGLSACFVNQEIMQRSLYKAAISAVPGMIEKISKSNNVHTLITCLLKRSPEQSALSTLIVNSAADLLLNPLTAESCQALRTYVSEHPLTTKQQESRLGQNLMKALALT